MQARDDPQYIDFLGDPWHARLSTITANIWRGVPFVAIMPAGRAADHLAFAVRGGEPRRRRRWQQFWYVTLPLLTPIIAVVMTFSVLFTFTDFQLIYVLTRGGPLNATHLMATLSFQRAISGGAWARARRSPPRWSRSCWRRSCSAISVCSGARGSRAGATNDYRQTRCRGPRGFVVHRCAENAMNEPSSIAQKAPEARFAGHELSRVAAAAGGHGLCSAAVFLFVLLFPFYWMTITDLQAERGAAVARGNPFWVHNPTLAHIKKLLFDTAYPGLAVEHDVVSVVATFISLVAQRARRLRDRAAALRARATSA